MDNKLLQALGDLCFIQKKHGLDRGTVDRKTFSEQLVAYGYLSFQYLETDHATRDKYKLLARDCAAIGLEVEEGVGWIPDHSWRHSGSNDDIKGCKITIRLPLSPALKVLYGTPNISK